MSNIAFVLRFTLSHPGTSNPVRLATNIAVAEREDRFLPTSMKRPRSAFRSRTPANQKPAASALRDYCRPRVDCRDAADEPDRTLAAGLPHMPMSGRFPAAGVSVK
jgi:hypothetical protein